MLSAINPDRLQKWQNKNKKYYVTQKFDKLIKSINNFSKITNFEHFYDTFDEVAEVANFNERKLIRDLQAAIIDALFMKADLMLDQMLRCPETNLPSIYKNRFGFEISLKKMNEDSAPKNVVHEIHFCGLVTLLSYDLYFNEGTSRSCRICRKEATENFYENVDYLSRQFYLFFTFSRFFKRWMWCSGNFNKVSDSDPRFLYGTFLQDSEAGLFRGPVFRDPVRPGFLGKVLGFSSPLLKKSWIRTCPKA